MASNITLSAGVRQNLLSLQSTAAAMSQTQSRLSTGKKVNSALDNPVNFFTSSSLQARAGDLSSLIDSMSNGVKQLQAADNGITSITSTVQSMQSTIRQARQDKSFKTDSYTLNLPASPAGTEQIAISGGAVGTTPVNVDLTTSQGVLTSTGTLAATTDFAEATDAVSFSVSLDGGTTTTAVNITKGTAANSLKVTVGSTVSDNIAVTASATVSTTELVGALNTGLTAANLGVTATGTSGAALVLTGTASDSSTASVSVTNFALVNGGAGTALTAAQFGGWTPGGVGATAGGTATKINITAKTVDQLVTSINHNSSFTDKVVASSDNGKLRLQNLSTADLTVGGASNGVVTGAGTSTIGGNDVRKTLVTQFNTLLDQLNKTADDSSFNGINLLRADKLKLTFNEIGTSTLEIQAKDVKGNATSIDAAYLGIKTATNADFGSDSTLDSLNATMTTALSTLRSQASAFGSNLSVVQNRQDFTKSMINTLQTGADNLVLADTNEEGANLLALQTRQQLSTTALSLSSQADQAVLRLF